MTTIFPTDTSGTKWHKLGEISKGLLQTPSEILVEYSDPQKFTSNSSLADAWSNRWAYNDTTSNVVLTIDPQLYGPNIPFSNNTNPVGGLTIEGTWYSNVCEGEPGWITSRSPSNIIATAPVRLYWTGTCISYFSYNTVQYIQDGPGFIDLSVGSNYIDPLVGNPRFNGYMQVIGISAPAAMQIGQEAYLYQASTGTITIDKGANTIVGPLATTGAGQILVVKKIGANSFYTYQQKKS